MKQSMSIRKWVNNFNKWFDTYLAWFFINGNKSAIRKQKP